MVKILKVLAYFGGILSAIYISFNAYSELRRDVFVPYPRGIVGRYYELDAEKTRRAISEKVDGINLDDFLVRLEDQKKSKKIRYRVDGDNIAVLVYRPFLGLPIGSHITLFYFNVTNGKVYIDRVDWTSVFI